MKRMNNDMAVSPIVATLVLIVVAVIGAVAVGTIMGTFSTQVSKQANAGQAASASQNEIIIAGSTTCIPVEQNLAADFQRQNPGVQINVQGGGSSEGPQSVALGIADIGATSSFGTITSAMTSTANANNPIYQNLYYTQIGGRGVVFIQHNDNLSVTTNLVQTSDVLSAYSDAAQNAGVTSTTDGAISSGTTMEQREAGSGTMATVYKWAGGILASNASANTALTGCPVNNGNAAMLAAVSGTAHTFGFVDAGYAITGGVTSNTTAPGITIVGVTQGGVHYIPTHSNIKNALKDWYYGNAQDTTPGTSTGAITTGNYPQGLTGGLYWITTGTSPSSMSGNKVVEGTSSAVSVVQGLIQFAKTPSEQSAFSNAGVYSMYDFI